MLSVILFTTNLAHAEIYGNCEGKINYYSGEAEDNNRNIGWAVTTVSTPPEAVLLEVYKTSDKDELVGFINFAVTEIVDHYSGRGRIIHTEVLESTLVLNRVFSFATFIFDDTSYYGSHWGSISLKVDSKYGNSFAGSSELELTCE